MKSGNPLLTYIILANFFIKEFIFFLKKNYIIQIC